MEQAQRVLPIILEKDALHRNFDDALFYGLMYYAEEESYQYVITQDKVRKIAKQFTKIRGDCDKTTRRHIELMTLTPYLNFDEQTKNYIFPKLSGIQTVNIRQDILYFLIQQNVKHIIKLYGIFYKNNNQPFDMSTLGTTFGYKNIHGTNTDQAIRNNLIILLQKGLCQFSIELRTGNRGYVIPYFTFYNFSQSLQNLHPSTEEEIQSAISSLHCQRINKLDEKQQDKIKEDNNFFEFIPKIPTIAYVYALQDKETKEILYIGKTTQENQKRYQQHLADLQTSDKVFYPQMRADGYTKDNIEFIILEDLGNQENLILNQVEKELILKYKPRYNTQYLK